MIKTPLIKLNMSNRPEEVTTSNYTKYESESKYESKPVPICQRLNGRPLAAIGHQYNLTSLIFPITTTLICLISLSTTIRADHQHLPVISQTQNSVNHDYTISYAAPKHESASMDQLDNLIQLHDVNQQSLIRAQNEQMEKLKQFTGYSMEQRQILEIETSKLESIQSNPTINSAHSDLKSLKCLTTRQDLDRCSAQLIAFGSTTATYPNTMKDLDDTYCPRVKKLTACIKTSSLCYSRFDRQIIDWVLSSTRKMSMKRCKNDQEKHRFVRMVNSCFEPMDSMKDKCMHSYIGSLDAIAEDHSHSNSLITGDDIGIQLSCCANRRFKSCMMREAKQHCKPTESLSIIKRTNSNSSQRIARQHYKRSMKDMMNDIESTLDDMTLSGPHFFCTGVTEHFCKKQFDGRYAGKSPKHKSLLPSMIAIYSGQA